MLAPSQQYWGEYGNRGLMAGEPVVLRIETLMVGRL
ncbi:hypothetical protein MEI_00909 [Bartonella vinsonii subsp. arupensis Pm136co]|uniref:Peptidylprolyl isomerase n=1 Tax=Bartonella vinsonii subsp. arupensis Pm136co TaxID=1094561 RepID=A0ABN0GQ34_BARVI|nr:hypothetical protein MEI_00909 [Bartonella vinsonii subsp. arupensis Pm136co]